MPQPVTIYHTYASLSDFRDYLAGTSYSSNWTADTNALRRLLFQASRRIDQRVNDNSFGPFTATRYYDIGNGPYSERLGAAGLKSSYLRNDPRRSAAALGILPAAVIVNEIPFGAWANSITSVTAYDDTARTTNETLTEGYANDYFLLPYNSIPYWGFKLNEDTAKTFSGGQQTLAIAATWGWRNTTKSATTLNGAVSSTTTTSITVTDGSTLSEGNTILVNAEQMYVESISTHVLTVVRGVHGTTAATHSNSDAVVYYTYPEDVLQTCLDLARVEYRNRDMGVQQTFGGEIPIAFPTNEARSILKTLDPYVAYGDLSGAIF